MYVGDDERVFGCVWGMMRGCLGDDEVGVWLGSACGSRQLIFLGRGTFTCELCELYSV